MTHCRFIASCVHRNSLIARVDRITANCLAAVIAMVLLFMPRSLDAGWISQSPSEDAYARGGNSANDTHGGGNLLIKNDASIHFSRKSWIQFDISSITTEILDAGLDLTLIATEPTGDYRINVFGLNDGVAGETWQESTLTWNNAPGNDTGSREGVNGDATLLGQLTIPSSWTAGDVFSFSGTSLTDFLNADSNGYVSFILTGDSRTHLHGATFASKESASYAGPVLRTDTATVPEPGSFFLFGIGVIGLCGYARTRSHRSRQSHSNLKLSSA